MSTQAQLLKQQALERTAARRMAASAAPVSTPAPAPVSVSTPSAAPIPRPAPAALPLVDENDSIWGAILGTLMGLALAGGGFAIGVGAFGLTGETQSYWYLSRAAGFVAYLLLWGSVAWGLLLSTKIAKGAARAPVLLDAHQFLSGIGVGFAFFHGLILMGDRYLSFPLRAVLVPFAGEYEPLLVAAGQIGLWLSALLIVTFYVRKQIGQKLWRLIHYSSFLAFWLVLIHAAAMGTESKFLGVQFFYLLTGGAILFLTYYRFLTARSSHTAVPA